ncbi:MAG: AMP-binding protein, partial [Rhodanobacter sp.]
MPLRYVIFGGEALDLGVLTAWFDRLGFEQPKLLNMYGITETTVHVSFCEIDRPTFERKSQGSPIGGPLPDLKWYVLDDRLEKVKPGTPGEIYVSGPGLARGYLLKPAFTAGRYIPDPYGEAEGGRLYKTGDLARWTSDNHLEYIGRSDQQVKLRGFRIELGEVSAAARGHAAVQDAEAVVIDTDANDRRLTLFVVPDLQGIREQAEIRRQSDDPLASNLAEDWEEIFDTTYETAPFSPSFVGWNSSYSDRPIPFEEMNEWLLGTVRRIKDLRPRKVLEIGCGLGLVLQHIAPACESYTGIDFSQSAISNLTQWVAKNGYTNVKLFTSQANQLADCVGGPFDTIIINSVAQYFPSWEYFHEVLGSAVSRLTENGAIFLGDLRPYANQASFHTAIQMARASG